MSKEATSKERKKKITKHEFYFETPLYDPVKVSEIEDNVFSGTVDAYNSMDDFDTTYDIRTDDIKSSLYDNSFNGFNRIILTCKRGGKTTLRFIVVELEGGYIMKIGQYPSLADIQFADIGKKYNKHLSKEGLRNYKKAIGGFAHGIGAGSFVYLRRIFENLIMEAYQDHKATLGLDDQVFFNLYMPEKIEALKSVLPSQLVEMKSIYGILSKGVHELTEEECLKYFPSIRLSIGLILDQKIEAKQKEDRDASVKKELQMISKALNGKDEKSDEQEND